MSRSPTLLDLAGIRVIIKNMLDGKTNNHGTVTLSSSTSDTTTTILDPRISVGTRIMLMATTANAATEFGAGTVYVSGTARGSATLTHAASTQADRSFDYATFG